MNKKVIIAIVIVLILLVGAVMFLMNRKTSTSSVASNQTQQQMREQPTQAIPDFMKAMQGTGSVKCTYSDDGFTNTTYIKNGKVRFEASGKGVTNNGIIVDKTMYSWMTGSKTGYMMDLSSMMVSVTPSAGKPEAKSMDSIRKDLESYHPTCSNETVADAMFEKPADITFSDMSKMMNEMKSKMPANVTIPQGYKIPNQ